MPDHLSEQELHNYQSNAEAAYAPSVTIPVAAADLLSLLAEVRHLRAEVARYEEDWSRRLRKLGERQQYEADEE